MAAAIARSQGAKTANDGVRVLVADLLSHAGLSGPPTDLISVATLAGIVRVEVADLDVDGELVDTTDGLVARVDRSSPHGRRRFTTAHEIGHALLLPVVGRPRGRAACGGNGEIERLCDLAAAEILMPVEQLREVVQASGRGAQVIQDVARAFGVSLQAAAVRVCENIPWCTAAALVEPGQRLGVYASTWTVACSSSLLSDEHIQRAIADCVAAPQGHGSEVFLGSGGRARRCVLDATSLGGSERVLMLIRHGP